MKKEAVAMIYSKWTNGTEDFETVRALRRAVFLDDMGISEASVFDVYDPAAMHALLYDADEPVGTGRLYYDGEAFCIGRICVLKDRRGRGFGDMIARLLLDRALNVHAPRIRLHAPPEQAGFYEKFGFGALDGTHEEDGRLAVRMEALANDVVFPSACGHGGHSGR